MILAASVILLTNQTETIAQVLGEKAEMDRLEVKAEEALANGDPHGATLTIGRAALMASMLAKKEPNPRMQLLYESAEDLFRTQENAYRALALFEQAGGQPPAPSGVCQLLNLAQKHGADATRKLNQIAPGVEGDPSNLYEHLNERTPEWVQIVKDLQTDFSCS